MTNDQLWKVVLGELELSTSKANFTTWFKNTGISSKTSEDIIISVPNGFTKEWLENKYHKQILQGLRNICPKINKISYVIGEKEKPTEDKEDVPSENTVKIEGRREYNNSTNSLNPDYKFENYIVGSHNELAHAACSAVSKKLGATYNPLFIYGGVGLGKTHLLQSIGNEVMRKNPNIRVKYASSEKFTSELVNAIAGKNTKAFKDIYRQIDILIIDDIQFLAGKEKTQEEFFHTFNTLYENNKQVVLSSDRPPKAIPALEERLRSRFEGGMIADISSPDYETRLAILKAKTKERDFDMPDESLGYIAIHIQKNIRELQGALNRVMAICELDGGYPDLKKTTTILQSIITQPIKKATNPKDILKTVSDFYRVPLEELIRKNRKREIVKPRQISMYLMRSEIKSSFPSIGSWVGGRDHTTAMHAYDKILKEIENDNIIEQEINLIIKRLYD